MWPLLNNRFPPKLDNRTPSKNTFLQPLPAPSLANMELPDFLAFTPVPLRRVRAGGWTPDRQTRFILALARGAGVNEAAKSLGCSRQTAHALRGRPGGESFSAAWDRAVEFAALSPVVRTSDEHFLHGIETLLVPRYYRGRLIGFVQKQQNHAALRTLKMLDRLADQAA